MADGAPSGAPTGEADVVQPVRAALRGVASLVAPTTLVTALLYYFGWARTSTQADVLGLNDSLLGLSSDDYLLRSIDPMYWPIFVGVLAALALLALHAALLSWLVPVVAADGSRAELDEPRRRLLTRVCAVLAVAGGAALVLGILGANVATPTRAVSLWSPPCLTASIVLLGYSLYLAARFLVVVPERSRRPEVRHLAFLASVLVVVLVLLSLFWSVARYAEIKGIDLALVVESRLETLPDAVVYSPRRLHLPEPVQEAALASPEDSAYRFRYSGLKLLFRSGGRVFLRPSDPAVSHVNIVIAENDELRFEFGRGWRP